MYIVKECKYSDLIQFISNIHDVDVMKRATESLHEHLSRVYLISFTLTRPLPETGQHSQGVDHKTSASHLPERKAEVSPQYK